MNGRIIVGDNIELDLLVEVPVPVNFSIADSKEPNKRKRNYSKTITLPGTRKNLDYFVSAYSLSMTTNDGVYLAGYDFDPTQRVPVLYMKNSIPIFKGLMQLNEVTIEDGIYSFDVTLHSDFIDWFMSLGETLVSELNWNTYSHPLTREVVAASWDESVYVEGSPESNFTAGKPLGFGYVYPLAEYGFPRTTPTTWKTYDLIPMVYVREVMIKSAQLAGLTIESDWLDSDLMRSAVFGYGGGDKQVISSTVAADRLVEFDGVFNKVDEVSYNTYNSTQNTATYIFNDQVSLYSLPNFTIGSGTDALGQFDNDTGILTIAQNGLYNISVSGSMSNTLAATAMELVIEGGSIGLHVKKNGAIQPGFSQIFSSTDSLLELNVVGQMNLQAGDTIELYLFRGYTKVYYVTDFAATEILNIELEMTNGYIELRAVNTTLTDGDYVELSRFIPEMKVSDFMSGMIKAFNLYVSDPDADGVIRIEPMDEYYLSTGIFDDYTQIVDLKKPIKIKPAASIEGKVYKFMFYEDSDYDNKRYKDQYNIGYGNRDYQVESTFQKGDRPFQLPFAQSVPIDIPGTTIVLPRIINFDEDTLIAKPYKGKPRIYFYNGLKPGNWRLTNTSNTTLFDDFTTYPCIHHFDDKDDPEFDFNWQLPQALFYSATVVTTSNLFSVHHERSVRETTSKDSKIVELSVFYKPANIPLLRFEKLKMWNGVLYRLNEVKDFDSDVSDTTVIELMKVLDAKSPRKYVLGSSTLSITEAAAPVISGGLSDDPDTDVISGGIPGSNSINSSLIVG